MNVGFDMCHYIGIECGQRKRKYLKKNLEALPGKHPIDSLQRTAVLGTSHIIRKVLQCETLSRSGGDRRWFKRSTRK